MRKPITRLTVSVLIMLLPFLSFALSGPQDKTTGGPLPAANVDGLPQFIKLLTYAKSNIAEGDFEAAIENLKDAQKIHPDDPIMHEMFGLAYDGHRNGKKALTHFLNAGRTFFKEGNIDKAWKMIGWIKTIDAENTELIAFEKEVRKQQGLLNQHAQNKKKREKERKK